MYPPDTVLLRASAGLLAGYALYAASMGWSSKTGQGFKWTIALASVFSTLLTTVGSMLVGSYGAIVLAGSRLANMPELSSSILIGLSGVAGIWANAIALQFFGNILRGWKGEKPLPIEWIRRSPRKRKPAARQHSR